MTGEQHCTEYFMKASKLFINVSFDLSFYNGLACIETNNLSNNLCLIIDVPKEMSIGNTTRNAMCELESSYILRLTNYFISMYYCYEYEGGNTNWKVLHTLMGCGMKSYYNIIEKNIDFIVDNIVDMMGYSGMIQKNSNMGIVKELFSQYSENVNITE